VITFCYLTNRLDCRIQWFFDSLHRELQGEYSDVRVVVVDFFQPERTRIEELYRGPPDTLFHVEPKPNVWQGKHRLTQTDFFAAANARNTGLCLAPDGYIVYVDDLSWLYPGWINEVRWGVEQNVVVAGSYKKVTNLDVEKGELIRQPGIPISGVDSRLIKLRHKQKIWGGSVFGCSVGCPVEPLLEINGWDEDCDSMGAEDYIFGLQIGRKLSIYFCPKMLTYESEELHHQEAPLLRIIKQSKSDIDASHAMLNSAKSGKNPATFSNFREVRRNVLDGQPFPIVQIPEHDWRDGQPLETMGEELRRNANSYSEKGWTKLVQVHD